MEIPESVKKIIRTLESSGCSAYAVGGCVRDKMMGIEPHDWDLCTSALPEQVLSALGSHNVIESGLKHGTVTVKVDGQLYEITTFRTDGEYLDNRRPESVTFVTSVEDDLSRRDFTINAMAYNPKDGLIDLFGGMDDISSKTIRCVGDAEKRFEEDALRILRALRFSSRLGFEIEPGTLEAAKKKAYLLKNISAERIASELLMILDGEYAPRVLIDQTEILSVILPEIKAMIGFLQYNPHHIYDVWQHTVKVVEYSPHGKVYRLAALMHDIGKPACFTRDEKGIGHFHGHPELSAEMAVKIMKRLKLDNNTISEVREIILYHDRRPPADKKGVRKFISGVGKDRYLSILRLKRADAKAQNPAMLEDKLHYIDELERICEELTENGEEFSLRTLKINGKDLISIGISEGRQIGTVLHYLLDLVVEGTVENDHEVLMQEAKKYAATHN